MKVIDKKGKLFGIINVVDLIIVLLIIAVIGAALYKVKTKADEKAEAESNCTYSATIIMRDLYAGFGENFKVGDPLYDGVNTFIGTISDVKVSTSMREVTTADGRIVLAPVPNREQAEIIIKGESIYDETQGLLLGKDYKLLGSGMMIKNSRIIYSCNVIKIEHEPIK